MSTIQAHTITIETVLMEKFPTIGDIIRRKIAEAIAEELYARSITINADDCIIFFDFWNCPLWKGSSEGCTKCKFNPNTDETCADS